MSGATRKNITEFIIKMREKYSHFSRRSDGGKWGPIAIYFNPADAYAIQICMIHDAFDINTHAELTQIGLLGTLFGISILFSKYIPVGYCLPVEGWLLPDDLFAAKPIKIGFHCTDCGYTNWDSHLVHTKLDCDLHKVDWVMMT